MSSQDLVLQQIKDVMVGHHPLAGMMVEALEYHGGQTFLNEWSGDNPSKFFALMFSLIPNAAPVQGIQGALTITINNQLGPTDLDSTTLDEQGRVIEVV
jgi:hypothetical protein